MRLWPFRGKPLDDRWGDAVELKAGQPFFVFDPALSSVHITNSRPSSIRMKTRGGILYLHIEDEVNPPA